MANTCIFARLFLLLSLAAYVKAKRVTGFAEEELGVSDATTRTLGDFMEGDIVAIDANSYESWVAREFFGEKDCSGWGESCWESDEWGEWYKKWFKEMKPFMEFGQLLVVTNESKKGTKKWYQKESKFVDAEEKREVDVKVPVSWQDDKDRTGVPVCNGGYPRCGEGEQKYVMGTGTLKTVKEWKQWTEQKPRFKGDMYTGEGDDDDIVHLPHRFVKHVIGQGVRDFAVDTGSTTGVISVGSPISYSPGWVSDSLLGILSPGRVLGLSHRKRHLRCKIREIKLLNATRRVEVREEMVNKGEVEVEKWWWVMDNEVEVDLNIASLYAGAECLQKSGRRC